MIRSMTGFSKAEVNDNGINAVIEIKSLNGKGLDISARMPRNLNHKEIELRDILKKNINRGTVSININVSRTDGSQYFTFNSEAAKACYNTLNDFRKEIKLKESVKLEHVIHFAHTFPAPETADESDKEWAVVMQALKTAVIGLNKMKAAEGQQITKDITARIKKVQSNIDKIEAISANNIPEEREKLRMKIAQLFDSDEIDEHRIQMELVLIADKLDISEECVRMRSHFKFFFESFKEEEPVGRKLNFLMQEMNREVNTIGSKSNNSEIAHLVVATKEELERVREQVQNLE